MITIVKKLDKTYGGYEYVEYDAERKVFKSGQTRAHRGHYPAPRLFIEVATLKELDSVEQQLIEQGFTYDKEWEEN